MYLLAEYQQRSKRWIDTWVSSVLQVNASDARGKADRDVQKGMGGSTSNMVKELITNRSLSGSGKKLALIMDEVDGMSGGDRGGVQDLIQSIQKSKIPIICICNDKYNQKIKSLVGHCMELNFQKPNKQQIARRLAEVAGKEGMHVEEVRGRVGLSRIWCSYGDNSASSFEHYTNIQLSSARPIRAGSIPILHYLSFKMRAILGRGISLGHWGKQSISFSQLAKSRHIFRTASSYVLLITLIAEVWGQFDSNTGTKHQRLILFFLIAVLLVQRALDALVESVQCDIRLALNHLQVSARNPGKPALAKRPTRCLTCLRTRDSIRCRTLQTASLLVPVPRRV